jgi:hypothetical protein
MMIMRMLEEAVLSLRRGLPLPTIKPCSKERESANLLMKTINNSRLGHLRNQELHLLPLGLAALNINSQRLINLGTRVITEVSRTLMMRTMGKELISLTLTAASMIVLMILTH